MPETELKCRDDVYRKIKGFISDKHRPFYVEQHRQRFINEMLHAAGPDVLPFYVSLLETQAQARSGPEPHIIPIGNAGIGDRQVEVAG